MDLVSGESLHLGLAVHGKRFIDFLVPRFSESNFQIVGHARGWGELEGQTEQ